MEGMGNPNGTEVFALPVQDAFLIFSPLQQVSCLLNSPALDLFREVLSGARPSKALPEEMTDLVALVAEEAVVHPESMDRPFRPQLLGLIPTRACNIACRYCDFGSDQLNHRTMDLKMAVDVVSWYADFLRASGQPLLNIHFFGGEPFVARQVVETVVRQGRALAGDFGLTPHFEVSTNGVFEKEYAKFVGDHFDAVVLSFDGFQETHDRHRPINSKQGSFSEVVQSARILSQSPTELCLRCCVSSENVLQLEEIVDWFCREFQPAVINFEGMTKNPRSLLANLLPPDPYIFTKHFFSAQAVGRKYGIPVVYAATEDEAGQSGFCPVGKDTLIVSPDGRISSCYLPQSVWRACNLDMAVGRVSQEGQVSIDLAAIQRLRHLTVEKPRCLNCFCRWTCSGGCQVSNTYPGCSLLYEDFCIQTRLLMACKLLDALGEKQKAEALLADRRAMQALALNPSDRVLKRFLGSFANKVCRADLAEVVAAGSSEGK
jgi:uncharacterized protein